MEPEIIGKILLAILMLLWLYKCAVLVPENYCKIVEKYTGVYKKGFCGIPGKRIATEEDLKNNPDLQLGDLIDGKKTPSLVFIAWPYYRIATYNIKKIVPRNSKDLTESEKGRIAWGDPNVDAEVFIFVESTSNHYRMQSTLRLKFSGLSTGKTQSVANSTAQNVKMTVMLNATTYLCNPYRCRYQESDGGAWVDILNDVIMSALSQVWGTRSFDDISDLRAQKFNDIPLENNKKFLERVDEEMLSIKKIGQGVKDVIILDDDVMPESKRFVDAKEDVAVAQQEEVASVARGAAEAALIKPKVAAAEKLMKIDTANKKALKSTVDATTQKKFESIAQSKVTVYVEAANDNAGNPANIDPNKLIQNAIGLNIAKQVDDESNTDNSKTKKK